MDIKQYTGYFHDGYIINIIHLENNIYFYLESSVIENLDEIKDKEFLSDNHTFKGVLKACDIKKFKIGNEKYEGILQMQYDDGDILDLKIINNQIFLLIEWKNYPPKPQLRTNDVSKIEIEAEKIYWENIPDLSDDYFKQN